MGGIQVLVYVEVRMRGIISPTIIWARDMKSVSLNG